MGNFFLNIFNGWSDCLYNYKSWRYMLESPYNSYYTWEFFSYLNQEIQNPYTIYLNVEDYDKLIQMLDDVK